MPIWKFQEDTGGGGTTELEDISLDLSVMFQSLENAILYLRAHDGVEFEDFLSYLQAIGVSFDDLTGEFLAYYQSLENLGVDFSTWGTDYKNAMMWLASYYQDAATDAAMDIWVVATVYEHLQTVLHAVATNYGMFKTSLEVLALGLEHMPLYMNSAGYLDTDNFRAYLEAASSTVLTDFSTYLWASQGLVTEDNLGLCLVTIFQPRGQYVGAYQRTSCVIRIAS